MRVVLIVAVVAVALLLLDRLARWLEDRGHLTYRKRGGGAGVGNALLEMQALFEPDRRHVVEERQAVHDEVETSGDPQAPADGRSDA